LGLLPIDRASVAQRTRSSHAPHVIWKTVGWYWPCGSQCNFGAGWGEFFATQQRNDTLPKRKGDGIGRLDRVGAAGSA
jgi:hypothetical protein